MSSVLGSTFSISYAGKFRTDQTCDGKSPRIPPHSTMQNQICTSQLDRSELVARVLAARLIDRVHLHYVLTARVAPALQFVLAFSQNLAAFFLLWAPQG